MLYCLGWTLGMGMQDHHEEAHTGSPTALRGDRPDKCPRPGTAGMLGAICIRQRAGRRRCMPAMANGMAAGCRQALRGCRRRRDTLTGRRSIEVVVLVSDQYAWDGSLFMPRSRTGGVALLLDSLRGIGAAEQATALADRAATRAPPQRPGLCGPLARQPAEGGRGRAYHHTGSSAALDQWVRSRGRR